MKNYHSLVPFFCLSSSDFRFVDSQLHNHTLHFRLKISWISSKSKPRLLQLHHYYYPKMKYSAFAKLAMQNSKDGAESKPQITPASLGRRRLPKTVKIWLEGKAADGDVKSVAFEQAYPVQTLIRFSGEARRQFVGDQPDDFFIRLKAPYMSKDIQESLLAILAYLWAMNDLSDEGLGRSPTPRIFMHIRSITHALSVLEILQFLSLREDVRQDGWVRKLILAFTKQWDVLPVSIPQFTPLSSFHTHHHDFRKTKPVPTFAIRRRPLAPHPRRDNVLTSSD